MSIKKEKIYRVPMIKSEIICPDCGRTIIKDNKYNGCISGIS